MKAERVDILGLALSRYHLTGEEQEIEVSSDVSLVEILPASYFFRTYEEMNPMEEYAMDHASGRVLDIGAGAGCHSLHLQEKGLDVTAVERSRMLCGLMKWRGVKDIREMDLHSLESGSDYDTVLVLMNGAGLAGRMRGLEALIEKLVSFLSPKGQIFIDSSDISELFVDEEGAMVIDLGKEHQSEITYHLEYEENVEEFPWVFPDEGTIAIYALAYGLLTERITDYEGGFLLRLYRPSL